MDTQDRQSWASNEEEMELGLNGENDVMVTGDAKEGEGASEEVSGGYR